jgi:hypothetical protein
MAPSAVIMSQRNSVQKGWERERERDKVKEWDTEEEALERDRAVAGSMHSYQSNIEGTDVDKEEEEEEGETVAPTGKLSSALTPCHAMPCHALPWNRSMLTSSDLALPVLSSPVLSCQYPTLQK